MNICILGQFPPHIGGVSSHTYLLSRELVKRGDQVHVLTYPHKDIKDMDGIQVETAPTANIKGIRGFFFLISATIKLISMVRKYNVDLIHAHFLIPPGLIAVLVGGLTGKKVAVTVHGSDIFIQSRNPVLRPIINYVLKKADYIAVVDEAIKEQILKFELKGVDGKIKVTPNAVDLEKFKPQKKSDFREKMGLDPQKNLILFVGNLVPQKGLKYLLDAKKRMKSKAELVIVGDGPLMSELRETVKADGIEDVYFTGARRDVEQIMPAGDVFVLPSTSEGFPITLLEAFACGLPAVATYVGGVKKLVTPEVGFLVEPKDSAALGEALDKIIQDTELRHEMAENAPVKAKKYGYLEIPY
jgi:N-acetyl-alpha-D-glucosaminyl L-malate synthase BshA